MQTFFRTALALLLALPLAACGADSGTRTDTGALSPECADQVERCKDGCRAEADQAARGPCFDKCLRKARECN